MRITRHDRSFDVYTYTKSLTADGMEQRTYVKSITDMQGDIQPTGSKFDPAQYGINATPANARKLFIDSGLAVSIGLVIRDKIDGAMYMVKGLSTWYSHQELILEPYEVTLP